MICNTIGLTADSLESIYVTGGAEVAEVYGGLNYAQPIFYKTQTITGNAPLVFDSYPNAVKSYTIYGNMVQTGTPTPSDPITPQECGDRTGNILPKPTVASSGSESGIDWDVSADGVVTFSGTATNNVKIVVELSESFTIPKPLSSGGQGTFAINNTAAMPGVTIQFYNGETFVDGWGLNVANETSTTHSLMSEKTITKWVVDIQSGSEVASMQSVAVAFSDNGVIVSPFEPYGYKIPITCGGVTKTIYLDEPLRKLGDYTDEIDSVSGTVIRRVKKLTITGSETIHSVRATADEQTVCAVYRYTALGMNDIVDNGKNMNAISYPAYVSNTFAEKQPNALFYDISAGEIGANSIERNTYNAYLIVCIAGLETKQDYYDHFSSNPVTVFYAVETPTTEAITVPHLITTAGQNTLTIGTALQPSGVSITGHVKPTS